MALLSPSKVPLPPVEECLFGPSRQCPKITLVSTGPLMMAAAANGRHSQQNSEDSSSSDAALATTSTSTTTTTAKNHRPLEGSSVLSSSLDDGDDNDNDTDDDFSSIMYDSFHLGHWGEAAQQHDIRIEQLRKIASQGIVDEGSFRGIAWRVLLNYLPTTDIHKTWSEQVPPKRDFYKQLVEQYFQGSLPCGRELRGQESKKVRNRKSKKKQFTRMERLEEQQNNNNDNNNDNNNSNDAESTAGAAATGGAAPEDNNNKNTKEQPRTFNNGNTRRSYMMHNEVEDQLPVKFKELWKRSGITLDKLTTATSTNTIGLRLNHLVVPSFTEDSPQDDFQDFLEDAMLLEEIRKDVSRTMPHLLFFLEPTDDLGLKRYAALERILFLWAKLNKGVRYVQGMNEIAGTLYYVLANDHNSEWADHAEADTYFLFHTLMMDIRDVFVPDMDSHSTGIQGRIGNMDRLLQTHDPLVYDHLQQLGIDSHFYAYRWLTTLLSREFLLPDTIRLWDSMFASPHKENFLRYVCVTMVMMVRDDLLEGDFSSNLRLLQRYPPANVDAILESSRSLWAFEVQIGLACQKLGINWQEALQTITPSPSIIMAYGYKGGVPPNLQHRLESATEQLLGRAQRLWSGWNKEAETAPATTAAVAHPAPEPTAEPPARSRFWNRGRRGTNDSDTNLELNKAATAASATSAPSTPSKTTLINDSIPTTTNSNSSSTTTRRRIWSDSPKSRTPDGNSATSDRIHEVQLPDHAAPLPTLQTSYSGSSSATATPPSLDNTNSTAAKTDTSNSTFRLWNRTAATS